MWLQMMLHRFLISAAAAALLCGACNAAALQQDSCGAAASQNTIGMDGADAEAFLRRASHEAGGTLRIVKHGQPMTTDFSDKRLTAELDREGRVKRATCG